MVARAELDGLHDDLFVLACAVEDTERDLADAGGDPSPAELRRIIDWLVESARPVLDRRIAASPGTRG